MRRKTNRRKDAAHFRRTAGKTKAINLARTIFRGGIRL